MLQVTGAAQIQRCCGCAYSYNLTPAQGLHRCGPKKKNYQKKRKQEHPGSYLGTLHLGEDPEFLIPNVKMEEAGAGARASVRSGWGWAKSWAGLLPQRAAGRNSHVRGDSPISFNSLMSEDRASGGPQHHEVRGSFGDQRP